MSIFVGDREVKSVTLGTRTIASITRGERELFEFASPLLPETDPDIDYFSQRTLEHFAGTANGDSSGNWGVTIESQPDTTGAPVISAGQSLDALVTALGNATAGDVIVLGAGTHDWSTGTWSTLTKEIKFVGEAGAVVDGAGNLDIRASLHVWNVDFQNSNTVWQVDDVTGLVVPKVAFYDCNCTNVKQILFTTYGPYSSLNAGTADAGPANDNARITEVIFRGASNGSRVTVSGPSTGGQTDGFIKLGGNWENFLFENVNCDTRKSPLLYLGAETDHSSWVKGAFNWPGPRAIPATGFASNQQAYGWGDAFMRNVTRTTNGVTPDGNGISIRYGGLSVYQNVVFDYDNPPTQTDREGLYNKTVECFADNVIAAGCTLQDTGNGSDGFFSLKHGMGRFRDCQLGKPGDGAWYASYCLRGMSRVLRTTFTNSNGGYYKPANTFIADPGDEPADLAGWLSANGFDEFLDGSNNPILEFIDCTWNIGGTRINNADDAQMTVVETTS